MKYTEETISKIENAILEKKGRVQACKIAGINYQTFLNWLADPEKIEFLERIKKAEEERDDEITAYAELSIVKSMKTDWKAAAWWLERTNPGKYALKQKRVVEQHNFDAGESPNKNTIEKILEAILKDIKDPGQREAILNNAKSELNKSITESDREAMSR